MSNIQQTIAPAHESFVADWLKGMRDVNVIRHEFFSVPELDWLIPSWFALCRFQRGYKQVLPVRLIYSVNRRRVHPFSLPDLSSHSFYSHRDEFKSVLRASRGSNRSHLFDRPDRGGQSIERGPHEYGGGSASPGAVRKDVLTTRETKVRNNLCDLLNSGDLSC